MIIRYNPRSYPKEQVTHYSSLRRGVLFQFYSVFVYLKSETTKAVCYGMTMLVFGVLGSDAVRWTATRQLNRCRSLQPTNLSIRRRSAFTLTCGLRPDEVPQCTQELWFPKNRVSLSQIPAVNQDIRQPWKRGFNMVWKRGITSCKP